LALRKLVGVEMATVNFTNPMGSKNLNASVTSLAVPASGPVQEKSKFSKFISGVFDVLLCAASILLIAKVGIVFYAHGLDKDVTGTSNAISDAPSPYTGYLIRFNSQVCTLVSDFDG
jgi:hypothetical protein